MFTRLPKVQDRQLRRPTNTSSTKGPTNSYFQKDVLFIICYTLI